MITLNFNCYIIEEKNIMYTKLSKNVTAALLSSVSILHSADTSEIEEYKTWNDAMAASRPYLTPAERREEPLINFLDAKNPISKETSSEGSHKQPNSNGITVDLDEVVVDSDGDESIADSDGYEVVVDSDGDEAIADSGKYESFSSLVNQSNDLPDNNAFALNVINDSHKNPSLNNEQKIEIELKLLSNDGTLSLNDIAGLVRCAPSQVKDQCYVLKSRGHVIPLLKKISNKMLPKGEELLKIEKYIDENCNEQNERIAGKFNIHEQQIMKIRWAMNNKRKIELPEQARTSNASFAIKRPKGALKEEIKEYIRNNPSMNREEIKEGFEKEKGEKNIVKIKDITDFRTEIRNEEEKIKKALAIESGTPYIPKRIKCPKGVLREELMQFIKNNPQMSNKEIINEFEKVKEKEHIVTARQIYITHKTTWLALWM